MENKTLLLFTDGACRGNPGFGGAGAVLLSVDGREIARAKKFLGHCTNNIAEYRALILGLKGAMAGGFTNLEVYLDSELLANQINGLYKVKNENLKVLMKEIHDLIASFESVHVRHVRRCHNELADRLANRAIDEHEEG